MEPVYHVVAAVALVPLVLLKRCLRRRAMQAGRGMRRRLPGSTEPSTTGTYVVAAFFAAFGVYLLVFQTTEVTEGIPGWLSGAVLVVGSVVLVFGTLGRRKRRGAADDEPSPTSSTGR